VTTRRETAVPAWLRQLPDALGYPLTSDGRLVTAGAVTLLAYSLLVLSTFPQFTIQLLARNPADLPYGVAALTRETYLSVGWLGLLLVVAYALLTGIAATHAITLFRRARRTSASTVLGVVPGFLAAGCASCGAGVLGALGFVGAMAALPFEGNLLRLGGILLLLFFLGRTGDPQTCSIS
jgi:hypothetical protein